MKFDIKNRYNGSIIFTAEIVCEENANHSLKLGLAVKSAVKAKANLSDADLSGANLRDANLSRANLSDVDLSDADLSRANLIWANLSYADLSRANLIWANLIDANLSRANLSRANLSRANLSRANLIRSDLIAADLSRANLSDTDLRDADLSDADLSRANLSLADLSRADLIDVDLSRANLRLADLNDDDLRSFKACLWMTLAENPNEVAGLKLALEEGRIDGSKYEGECSCLVGTIAKVKNIDVSQINKNASNPSEIWFTMIRKGDKPNNETGGGFASKLALRWIEEWQALQIQGIN